MLWAFGLDRPVDDFGMLCLELYRYRADIRDVVCIDALTLTVVDYLNNRPPDPGVDAELTSADKNLGSLLRRIVDPASLDRLMRDGYVAIDGAVRTSQTSSLRLGKWARKGKTDQGPSVRSDTVSFLNREDAIACSIEHQYDFLLALASHLNEYYDLQTSPYEPVLPGTRGHPLTNPGGSNVQMAEYGHRDFYVPHSDNSVAMEVRGSNAFDDDDGPISSTGKLPKRRSNWRCITAILYLNEGWTASDGGQLRMYLNSAGVERPSTAADTHRHVDINPSNGKLLLFDSRMVHSVEEVLNDKGKVRRALTLWILRPENSGVTGEDYCLIGDDTFRRRRRPTVGGSVLEK